MRKNISNGFKIALILVYMCVFINAAALMSINFTDVEDVMVKNPVIYVIATAFWLSLLVEAVILIRCHYATQKYGRVNREIRVKAFFFLLAVVGLAVICIWLFAKKTTDLLIYSTIFTICSAAINLCIVFRSRLYMFVRRASRNAD